MAYRIFVTDALRYIPQNKYTTVSFYDMLYPKPADNRTAEQIVNDVVADAGLILR